MITKENLKEIDFFSRDETEYFGDNWQYMFNIKSQELWNFNDGFGEPDLLCKVTDFEKLKELLNLNVR